MTGNADKARNNSASISEGLQTECQLCPDTGIIWKVRKQLAEETSLGGFLRCNIVSPSSPSASGIISVNLKDAAGTRISPVPLRMTSSCDTYYYRVYLAFVRA